LFEKRVSYYLDLREKKARDSLLKTSGGLRNHSHQSSEMKRVKYQSEKDLNEQQCRQTSISMATNKNITPGPGQYDAKYDTMRVNISRGTVIGK